MENIMKNKCEMCKHITYAYCCGFNEPICSKKKQSLVFGLNREKWNNFAKQCKEFEVDIKEIIKKEEKNE